MTLGYCKCHSRSFYIIDYRKLNEIAISHEFPLLKQEDIFQALKGSQWLATLDALAGPEDHDSSSVHLVIE
jgi:hypothetical protein